MSFDFHAHEQNLKRKEEEAERARREYQSKLRGIAQELWYQIAQYTHDRNPLTRGEVDGLQIVLEYDLRKMTIVVEDADKFRISYEYRVMRSPYPEHASSLAANDMMTEVVKFVNKEV